MTVNLKLSPLGGPEKGRVESLLQINKNEILFTRTVRL